MSLSRSTGEWSLAVRQQASVARLGQLGLQGMALDELLGEALTAVADTLGVRTSAVLELLPGWKEFTPRSAIHDGTMLSARDLARLTVPAGRSSMPGYTVMQGTAVVSSDMHADQRFQAVSDQYGVPATSGVCAPVGWGEQPWGVLCVWSDVRREWTDDDVHFVQSVANTLGLAIARQMVETALRDSSARLDLSLGAGRLGAWTLQVEEDRLDLSPSALEVIGLTTVDYDGVGDSFMQVVEAGDRAMVRGDAYRVFRQGGGEQHTVFRVNRPDNGERRWLEVWGRLVTEPDGGQRLVGVVADITQRREAEEMKEALLEREQSARVAAELARERLTLLSEASARFSQSLDTTLILSSLLAVCVPTLADVCLVDLQDDGGELVEAAATAANPEVLATVRELRRRRAELGRVGGLWSERRVAGRVEPVLRPELPRDQIEAAAEDEEHLALYDRVDLRASIVVPMVARGRVMGVLTLMAAGTHRVYDADQLALVEELAARASLAIDNAKLFESRARVARSLQAALLPPALPDITCLDLAARYQVAESDTEIGGDFYDVIEIGPTSWGIVVGDVCGRGTDAAAITGLMRHSMRTAVIREQLPSRVLAQVNDAVVDQIDDASFCTAAFVHIEAAEEEGAPIRVVASSAGHPRPVVLRADGRAELIDCSGLLLGVVPALELVDVELDLGPGDTLVLYTDGVTEARCGRELFGEERLLEALRGQVGQDAAGVAAGLESAVRSWQDGADDDTAILVAQVPSGSCGSD